MRHTLTTRVPSHRVSEGWRWVPFDYLSARPSDQFAPGGAYSDVSVRNGLT